MFVISAIVLLTLTYNVSSGPAFESNPFLQVPATSKQPTPKPIQGHNVYVVVPSSGQQLQQSPPTASTPTVTPSASIGVLAHPFDCANRTNPSHVHSQIPVEGVHVQLTPNPSSNYNNVVNVAQASLNVNTAELNRKCLKSTGLFLGTSCNKFVSCLNGIATELNCPDGLLFNSEGLYCDRPENVECNGQTSAAHSQHQELKLKPGSPIHASLVQLSSVPPQHTGLLGALSAVHLSEVQHTGIQQQQNQQNQYHQQHQQQQHQQQQLHQQEQHYQQQHQEHQQHQHKYEQHQHQQQQVQQQQQQQQYEQHQHLQQQQHQQHQQQQHYQHQQQQQQAIESSANANLINKTNQIHISAVSHQQLTQQQQHDQQLLQLQLQKQQNFQQSHASDNLLSGVQQHNQHNQQLPQSSTNFLVQTNQVPIPIPSPQHRAPEDTHTNEISTSGIGGGGRCLALKGQFPSNACHTFVNCWAGLATEQACPDGLLFNTKGYCDYPENVNCAGRLLVGPHPVVAVPVDSKSQTAVSPTTPSFSPTTQPILAGNPTTLATPAAATLHTVAAPELKEKCLSARGQFPSTSCNKFVNCWDSVILEQDCPEGFLFSTKGYCDFSHKVDCGDRPVEPRGSSSKSECPLENGTFRDRNRCSSYFTCLANKVVARYECPDGLNYNDYIGVCDYNYRVDCSKEPLLIPGRRNNVPMLKRGDECPADFATYRDANNCGTYYTCVSRKIVATYECPVGFSFNDEIGICDYAEKVDCTKPPRIYQVPENVIPQVTNEIKQKLETCTPGTMFTLNPQCTAVCLCRNGMAEIIECPAGLAYDSKLDKCILPHLARC